MLNPHCLLCLVVKVIIACILPFSISCLTEYLFWTGEGTSLLESIQPPLHPPHQLLHLALREQGDDEVQVQLVLHNLELGLDVLLQIGDVSTRTRDRLVALATVKREDFLIGWVLLNYWLRFRLFGAK